MRRSELEHLIRAAGKIAGREKDREFTRDLARHAMTDRQTLLARLAMTKLDPTVSRLVKGRIERDFPKHRKTP